MPETEKSLHPFFVDAKRYETAKTALTGARDKGDRQCCSKLSALP